MESIIILKIIQPFGFDSNSHQCYYRFMINLFSLIYLFQNNIKKENIWYKKGAEQSFNRLVEIKATKCHIHVSKLQLSVNHNKSIIGSTPKFENITNTFSFLMGMDIIFHMTIVSGVNGKHSQNTFYFFDWFVSKNINEPPIFCNVLGFVMYVIIP